MANMDSPIGERDQRRGVRLLVILLVVSLVSVTLYSREGSSGPVHLLRSAVQTVATPFRLLGSQLVRPLDALGNVVSNLTADSATLEELQGENEQLVQQLAQFNEYKSENERLEAILALSSAYDLQGVAARVIEKSDETWTDTIVIDKGSTSGIRMDMPVTIGSGVIGQVCSVSATTSTVRLLTDPSMGVSAMLQNSRTTGILAGSVDGYLHLQYVTTDVDVSTGEIVVSSGLGGVYPKGLPLGRVVSVSSASSDQYLDITVEPISRASNYEEVFVITSFDDQLDGTSMAGDFAGSSGQASEAVASSPLAASQPSSSVPEDAASSASGEQAQPDVPSDQGQAEVTADGGSVAETDQGAGDAAVDGQGQEQADVQVTDA